MTDAPNVGTLVGMRTRERWRLGRRPALDGVRRLFLGIAAAVWLVAYSTFLTSNTSTVGAIIGIPAGAVLGWILLYAAMRGPRP